MKYRENKRLTYISVLCITLFASSLAYAACNFLNQFPTSSITNPDKLRGGNKCTSENDCQPGTYCSSFGNCERC